MAMVHVQLSDEELARLERQAASEGISVDELARRAVREHLGLQDRQARIAASAARIASAHADALERLGR